MKHIDPEHHDLITPDGVVTEIRHLDARTSDATLRIDNISGLFRGFQIPEECVYFNIKSTLAQVGVDGVGSELSMDRQKNCAEVQVKLRGYGKVGEAMLPLITPGAFIGKLFAADPRRRVREPHYLLRMFGRSDRWGRPLLSLGGLHGSSNLVLDTIDGRAVAFLTLQDGVLEYSETIFGFLPTLAAALHTDFPMREILRLHQVWSPQHARKVEEGELLLTKTLPLHIRTVFGRVVNELVSEGYSHTTASVLQPDTTASGDIYELYGSSARQLTDIPLEFYTLEPFREHVFFEDRDQLLDALENESVLLNAFATIPADQEDKAATFVVKGAQLIEMKASDWTLRNPRTHELPGIHQGGRQGLAIERYIEQQPAYPYLKAIDDGVITSQGILLTRYFPSPFMKRLLLSEQTHRLLKGIYFHRPSQSYGNYFSSGDRSLLHDLYQFGIPTYWVDIQTQSVLQYIQRPSQDSGLFVPTKKVNAFFLSTVFGIYGSNLLEGEFEQQLIHLMQGLLDLRKETTHPLLNPKTPIALVTGGGPGAMEVGNRVAKDLGILSCANVVDFKGRDRDSVINEQRQNQYIDAKMTYRLDKLVERQAEFNLDFPIFLTGGIGTDFELSLEEVRRKVGAVPPTPIILMGAPEYWRAKITSRFQSNLKSGTIKGSEWISNCFYVARTAKDALGVYEKYFTGTLPIGKDYPIHKEGFVTP